MTALSDATTEAQTRALKALRASFLSRTDEPDVTLYRAMIAGCELEDEVMTAWLLECWKIEREWRGLGEQPANGNGGVLSGEPFPKSAQLARGERRYRRKVASPKQWQAIIAAKRGPCRADVELEAAGLSMEHNGPIEYHHLVARAHGGEDVPDNIVPLHQGCHGLVTARHPRVCRSLLSNLTDAEYAYMIERGGEDYPERAYGVRYER